MKHKAQGLSLTVIIIGILALIVLVVLIAIFTGKIKVFGEGVENCATRGGSCDNACDQETQVSVPGTDCDKKNEVCCVKVYS